jgi:hypothetical protein
MALQGAILSLSRPDPLPKLLPVECPVWREQGGNMLGQTSKSSESTQVRIWQIFYIAGLILIFEYLTIMYFIALQ